jgi:hypothetical protein
LSTLENLSMLVSWPKRLLHMLFYLGNVARADNLDSSPIANGVDLKN